LLLYPIHSGIQEKPFPAKNNRTIPYSAIASLEKQAIFFGMKNIIFPIYNNISLNALFFQHFAGLKKIRFCFSRKKRGKIPPRKMDFSVKT